MIYVVKQSDLPRWQLGFAIVREQRTEWSIQGSPGASPHLYWHAHWKFIGQIASYLFFFLLVLVSIKIFLLFLKSQRLNFILKCYDVSMINGRRVIICWICVLGKSSFQENCISAYPCQENWSSQNPFVPQLLALSSSSKHDSETWGSKERMRRGSMSSLKNHFGFLMSIYITSNGRPLDSENNGVNLTMNRRMNRFY